jgi:hypothetical protein
MLRRHSALANKPRKIEHMFSIELKSKEYVKSLSFADDDANTVLIEGFLGKLKGVGFTEGLMFAVMGSNGILRMDLSEKEMKKLLPKKKAIHKKDHKKEESRT